MQGLIPRQFIDDLLTKIELVDLIDAYVPLKKRGLNYLACCPFHNEKTPSFNVIPKKQFYHCFGCGASGNAISFIMNYLHQSFPQTIETLAAKAGMVIPREALPDHVKQTISLHAILQKLNEFYQNTLRTPAGAVAIAYLKQRGINGKIAQQYQIGYAPQGWHTIAQHLPQNQAELIATGMLIQKDNQQTYDRYRHRIMFPIHDRHGRMTGFGGRALDNDQQPKYLNSPETVLFQKSHELYGLYQILQTRSEFSTIVIVEGYMDVIALAQHGITYAVATLGTATTAHHIQLLSKYTQDLHFCFDGDQAGRQAAWRALEVGLPYLDAGLQAHFIFLPDGHDPDSFIRAEGKDAFEILLQKAVPLHELLFTTLMKDIDTTDLTGKNRLIHMTKPYLAKIPDCPYKALLMSELARLTHIDQHRIEQLLEAPPPPQVEKPDHAAPHWQRTPLRIALALLIQNPRLFTQDLPNIDGSTSTDPDQILITVLMQHLAQQPQLNTATLVEHFRDTPWFEVLGQLAAWDHQVPDQAQASELTEMLRFLAKKTRESLIQSLIGKSKQQELSAQERQALQKMLRERHI
ncbi:MAG: DNA primase [Gammaproteobacteria bacterium]|nr:DNA primase [Gammaproteobacteria bacterium]